MHDDGSFFWVPTKQSVSCSVVSDSATPWTVAPRLLCPWDSPGKNTGVGCHFPSPGDLPDPGIKTASPMLAGRFLRIGYNKKCSTWKKALT